MNKEIETSLKFLRLGELKASNNSLTTGAENDCYERLLNFVKTIDSDSQPAKVLKEGYDRMGEIIEEDIKKLEGQFNRMGFLERGDYYQRESAKIEISCLRNFHSLCWEVALNFNLIPKE